MNRKTLVAVVAAFVLALPIGGAIGYAARGRPLVAVLAIGAAGGAVAVVIQYARNQ